MSSFKCTTCGEIHEGLPMAYRFGFPDVEGAGSAEYERDGELCKIGEHRYILANIELFVADAKDEAFVWTCWASLSTASYNRMRASWELPDREHQEPAFGWLSNALPAYSPTTLFLKVNVHTRAPGLRPWLELEPTEHPLAIEQKDGIERKRIAAVYHIFADQRS